MKKTILLFGLTLAITMSVSSQESGAKLAELFYGEKIERTINDIQKITPDSLKSSVLAQLNVKKIELLNKMAASYNSEFSSNEIQELILFYSSQVSKKWDASKGKLNIDNLEILTTWKRELYNPQGFNVSE